VEEKFHGHWPVSAGIGVVLLMFVVLIVRKISVFPPLGEFSIAAVKAEGSIMTIGKVLYTRYLLPFEIASLILLVAIIGAVILAKKRI
jgi:NADH-quinone oxidoreductase subunit J